MKNILNKFKINNYTYIFIILCALCGYIKNISIILSICLFHELGHIFFIKLFRYHIISIEILPFGGFTKIDKRINTSINKDIIISLGGIFFQLIIFLIAFMFKNNLNIITYNLIMNYNKILIIFNLIPIIPLDGNNFVHLILEKFFSYHLSYKLNIVVSFISLILFFLYNYFYHIDNYFIFSFLIYKVVCEIKNYKYLHNRFLLERYLNDIEYQKIDNNTKSINDLRKNVFHYFKKGNHYISEKKVIEGVKVNRQY